ncbi:hypothetical protein LW347_17510 [Pectobacterium polonicum]|uniref:Ketopantoate reductase N-terminal domain-containing protein n=1 Tax=Pectobacterium polonicum TaxID=2485124 RepID=A0AAE9SWK5_9GAMM|nr:2-dehydropantoate 2-reductase N-terminal domain-containing protein [Pectobacterium polonicum]UVO07628.1 hypothetical protein LW347_17510 [Pectobacterium polonicum]
MEKFTTPRVLIVGAGAMGIVVGHNLSLAKASVTYLVRPGNVERLGRPQMLYSYNDNTLKAFDDYDVITDHADIAKGRFDYIITTLDGASMQSDDGVELTKAIGKAALGSDIRVIQGALFFDSRRWFQHVSGLPGDQFTNGYLCIHAYPSRAVTLSLHGKTDPALLAKADLAYIDSMDNSLILSDSAPAVAKGFAEVYNACGVSHCGIVPEEGIAMMINTLFAMFAGCDLLGWPKFSEIDPSDDVWCLAIAAMKEIQGLSIYGEAGRAAVEATTEAGVLEGNVAWEQQMLPLDLQEFNRFHHGGKVSKQDHAIRAACLAAGRAEGKDMSALSELIRRVESNVRSTLAR